MHAGAKLDRSVITDNVHRWPGFGACLSRIRVVWLLGLGGLVQIARRTLLVICYPSLLFRQLELNLFDQHLVRQVYGEGDLDEVVRRLLGLSEQPTRVFALSFTQISRRFALLLRLRGTTAAWR